MENHRQFALTDRNGLSLRMRLLLPHASAFVARAALFSLAFQFHLAEAEGDAEAYEGGFVSLASGGLVLRRGGVASPFRPSEDVAYIQIDTHFALEKVATASEIDALVGVGETVESQARGTVAAVSENFQPVPHFGPQIKAEAVAYLAVAEIVVVVACCVSQIVS